MNPAARPLRQIGWHLFVALGLGALAAGYLIARRDLLVGAGYLFRDDGLVLSVADVLLRGGRLYQDAFWQYGPLPIGWHCLAASVWGNTPLVYLGALVPVVVADIFLAYWLLRRYLPPSTALVFMALAPGPWLFRLVAGGRIYVPFEVALTLLLGLAWLPPGQRNATRSLCLGLILGLMQGVKFGAAVVAGGALMLTDLLCLYLERAPRRRVLDWMRELLFIGAAFAVVEGIWVAHAMLTLPRELAVDVLFPKYMTTAYAAFASEGPPRFETWGIFIGTQLPALVCLVLGGATVWWIWRGPRTVVGAEPGPHDTAVPYAHLLFLFFYLVGLPLLFKHKWLVYQYAWLLFFPAAWAFDRARLAGRVLFALVLLPAALVLPFKIVLQKADTSPTQMPDGTMLWLNDSDRAAAEGIFRTVETIAGKSGARGGAERPAILVAGANGSGLHHFGQLRTVCRHTWFLPGWLRPHEEEAVFRRLNEAGALVVFTSSAAARQMTGDPATWNLAEWSPFAPARAAELAARLGTPVRAGDRWVVFPLKP